MAIIHITNFNDFKEKVEQSNKLSVVDFWASWCGPCKMISPIFDEVSKEYDDVNFVKVDIDEAQEIAIKFNIMSIPTLIIIKNGEVVDQTTGAMGKDAIKEFIDNHLE